MNLRFPKRIWPDVLRVLVFFFLVAGASKNVWAASYTYTNQEPSRAADFANSLGVGVHGGAALYSDNIAGVVSDISYLGFKHVRDTVGGTLAGGGLNSGWIDSGVYQGSAISTLSKLQQFAAAGIYCDSVITGDPLSFQASLDQYAP